MKYPGLSFRLGVSALALALSGLANGACYIGGETKASSVQSDSGNGTYACSQISTSKGTLRDVTSMFSSYISYVDGRVSITIPRGDDGYPELDIDLVSVSNNSGKRCNYTYADQPADTISGLSTSDLSVAKYVTICADTVIESPLPPEPYNSDTDKCAATFTNVPGEQFDVAIGYSKNFFTGGLEGAAICLGEGQKQCVNECVPRTDYATGCTVGSDGSMSLSCAQCQWKEPGNEGPQYCWFYENKVVLQLGTDGQVDVPNSTFKPSPKKKSLSAQIDVTSGSDCYTVTIGPTTGGKTYSYQKCP